MAEYIEMLDEIISQKKLEYQEAIKLNLISKSQNLLAEINYLEELKELRGLHSKIKKAIDEIEGEYSGNQDWANGLNRALEILKRNIGE